jgi:putative phosphoribosyl transferase
MNAGCFKDRHHAGEVLAQALLKYADRGDVIVLGLPRGGVPVAYEISKRLRAPLDVMVVRKLGVPGWEELAMGAIASGGVRVLNNDVILSTGVSHEVIEQVTALQQQELTRRELAYRGHGKAAEVAGRTVILVDDGIATGATIRAAIRAVRARNPTQLIVAVPVAPPETCAELQDMVDDLVSLIIPENFTAVGQWYQTFDQTNDEEVTELLTRSARDLETDWNRGKAILH